MDTTLGDRVRAERTARKWSQAELARRVSKIARRKVSQVAIHHIESRGNVTPRFLLELAQALEVLPNWLQTGRGAKDHHELVADFRGPEDDGASDAAAPNESPNESISTDLHAPPALDPQPNARIVSNAPPVPYRTDMDKDVPVFGTVVGGKGDSLADFELNGTIVDYVRRPPRLRGRTDIFAAFVQNDSMAYWREPGQLVYLEKIKPARVMDYVLVELKPHNGDEVRPALIKRLLAVTATKVRLRQYNPPKDFEIDRGKILQIVRVIDWDELMAV